MLDESRRRRLAFEKKNNHAELTMAKKRKRRETPFGFLFHRSEEQTYAHAARRNCRLTIVAQGKEKEVKAREGKNACHEHNASIRFRCQIMFLFSICYSYIYIYISSLRVLLIRSFVDGQMFA